MNVEVYDEALAEALEAMAAERIASATPWQRPERSPVVRLRNALAGLFRLYL